MLRSLRGVWLVTCLVALPWAFADAARVSDVAGTVHNLSQNWLGDGADPRNVVAVSEQRICVFCHTPHAAELIPAAPLWNRKLSTATYNMYDSSSMDATKPAYPANASKLCLSCHDGTLAVGAVNVLNGTYDLDPLTPEINLQGTNGNKIPDGMGSATGYTRNLGIDLSNDHPISIRYDTALAERDGELYDPQTSPHLGRRSPGVKPLLPLVVDSEDGEAKLECVSCHDPHLRDDSGEDIKFLRLNRFQSNAAPSNENFNELNDIICLGCHRKEGWLNSAHANEQVADERYNATAAGLRDFPADLPVWRAACLNCHDTHSVAGSRRLLREGTDDTQRPKSGGNPALEESCYQCHSNDGDTLISQGNGSEVPDIKSDFNAARHMPISSADQLAGSEVHDAGNTGVAGEAKELIESPLNLGKGALNNRHVECSDCHNPHRVIRNRLATSDPATPDVAGTHDHHLQQPGASVHNNLISGVLRGSWGVEPVYSSSAWTPLAPGITYQLKKGVAPTGTDISGSASDYPYVTREYQVCLKCHSDYSFDNDAPPQLGYSGGTPSGTNGMVSYTNQAFEFQAPLADMGEPGGNHRSWHPVIESTGRTSLQRGITSSGFLPPWDDSGVQRIGNQTMYCIDCHGSNTTGNTVVPDGGENGNAWGPHGSSNDFILKGPWSSASGTNTPDMLCFKCHDYAQYADPNNGAPLDSGFAGVGNGGGGNGGMCNMDWAGNNLHIGHAKRLGGMRCSWCHTMVPHGWKNKGLLVDISQEGATAPYSSGPYYENAWLGGGGPVIWKSSGNWTKDDCGGAWMNNSCTPTP